MPDHAWANGCRLFGGDRWHEITQTGGTVRNADQLLSWCFKTLHTAKWEDDLRDTGRTMSNMETATILYAEERLRVMDLFPVWVADEKDYKAKVGIEQVFDVVLQYEDDYKIRYIGMVDGLVVDANDGTPTLEDNKTAARIDSGFRDSTSMKSQFTGYMACSTALFGVQVFHGRVIGLSINRPNPVTGYASIPIVRDFDAILKWGQDVRWIVRNLYEPFGDDGFENAPRFTHSCNRYFRPCSLIPFCTDSPEGRQIVFYDEMVPIEKSPSERAVMEE